MKKTSPRLISLHGAIAALLATLLLSCALSLPIFFCQADVATARQQTRSDESSTVADQTNANFTNLIVFAKFDGETEFVDDVYDDIAVRKLIDNTYTVSRYSVADYFRSASNCKIRMQNLFLFAEGGSVTLSHTRGYYAEKDELNPDGYEYGEEGLRMLELKEDWTNAVNAAIANGAKPTSYDGATTYPLAELDKNNDGKIDAITVIYKNTTQNITVSWASPLWNYQDYTDRVCLTTTEGKTLTSSPYVQLTFTYGNADKTFVYTDGDGCKFVSPSTATHETGHIFGLKDLYRSANVSKIYYMSLMGKHLSPVGQFLSVKEREAMGWLDDGQVQTLTQEGKYTVHVSGSDVGSDVIGYKFDLPQTGKTLYLEYRRFVGEQNKYDTQSKTLYLSDGSLLKGVTIKSGLVCYLATTGTKPPDNMNTSGNNWNYEALGGTTATKNDCALAVGEGLDIPYSSLYVEVESATETELVFSVYGEELKAPQHTHEPTYVPEIAPTCTEGGQAAHYFCQGCGKYFVDEQCSTETTIEALSLPANGHTESTLAAKEPTCEEDGLTEGKQCSVCKQILQQQTVLPKLGHLPSDWIDDKTPTAEEEGLRHKECLRCGKTLQEETLPKLPPKDDTPIVTPPKDDKPSENPSDKPSDGTDNKPDNTPSDDIGNGDTPKDDTDPDTAPDYTVPIVVSAVAATTVIAAGAWFAVVKLRCKR